MLSLLILYKQSFLSGSADTNGNMVQGWSLSLGADSTHEDFTYMTFLNPQNMNCLSLRIMLAIAMRL